MIVGEITLPCHVFWTLSSKWASLVFDLFECRSIFKVTWIFSIKFVSQNVTEFDIVAVFETSNTFKYFLFQYLKLNDNSLVLLLYTQYFMDSMPDILNPLGFWYAYRNWDTVYTILLLPHLDSFSLFLYQLRIVNIFRNQFTR